MFVSFDVIYTCNFFPKCWQNLILLNKCTVFLLRKTNFKYWWHLRAVFKLDAFYINIVLFILLCCICIIFTIVIRHLMIIFNIENISTGYKTAIYSIYINIIYIYFIYAFIFCSVYFVYFFHCCNYIILEKEMSKLTHFCII